MIHYKVTKHKTYSMIRFLYSKPKNGIDNVEMADFMLTLDSIFRFYGISVPPIRMQQTDLDVEKNRWLLGINNKYEAYD